MLLALENYQVAFGQAMELNGNGGKRPPKEEPKEPPLADHERFTPNELMAWVHNPFGILELEPEQVFDYDLSALRGLIEAKKLQLLPGVVIRNLQPVWHAIENAVKAR